MNRLIPRGLPPGVWIITATSVVLMSGFGMVVPLLPIYAERLGASELQLGLLMGGFFGGRLLSQVPAGLATDRLGRRPVLLLALFGYVLTCVGYASSISTLWLIVFRLLQGLCSGFFSVAARSLVSDLCPPKLRGAGQGVYSSSVSLGFVIGPLAGSIIASHFTITTPFWVAALLSSISLIVLFPLNAQKTETDLVLQNPVGALFSVLSNGRIRSMAAAHLLFMTGLSAVMVLFPIAGETQISGGITFVGAALTTAGISGFIFAAAIGRLSDRTGRFTLMVAGAALASMEGITLWFTCDPLLIIAAFWVGGIGSTAFLNCLHAAIGDMTERSRRGTVTGIIGLAGQSGGMIGSLLAPFIWHHSDLHLPFAIQPVATLGVIALVFGLSKTKIVERRCETVIRDEILPG